MLLKLYLITLPVFLAIDAMWLSTMSKLFYQKHLGFLMTKSPNYLAAFIFYLIFAFGIVYFVVMPSLNNQSWLQAVLTGALFGLICYATYDLTNLATIKDWPLSVTIVDLIWGTTVTTVVSLIVYFIGIKFI